MKFINNQRGDTLVEVLLATVVISIVLAGAFTISNKALRINQTAQERTEVANKMREQAEILRSLAISQNSAAWNDLVSGTATGGVYFSFLNNPSNPSAGVKDTSNSSYVQPYANDGVDTYGARGVVDLFDIWVEQDTTKNCGGDCYTFIIKAEWEGIGSVGDQRSGLALRVEDKN